MRGLSEHAAQKSWHERKNGRRIQKNIYVSDKRILMTCVKMFIEKGFNKTTMLDII